MRRRSLVTFGMFSSLAILSVSLTACEDGPNQTFSPAPNGAGNLWNNGEPDASVGTASTSYDAGFNAITPLALCSSDKQRSVWANMLTQPMIPGDPKNSLHPTFAGLDLAGKDWGGISYEESEQQLCSGIDDGVGGACFGDNCEFAFFYTPSTHIISQIDLSLGYTGTVTWYSDAVQFPPTAGVPVHTYQMEVGFQITKDGQPWEIDWSDPTLESLMEIYYGQMFSFGGGIGDPGNSLTPGCSTQDEANAGKCPYSGANAGVYSNGRTGAGGTNNGSHATYQKGFTCQQDQSCLIYGPNIAPSVGGQCYFGIRPLLTYWNFECAHPIQPLVSTMDHMYYDFGKVLPQEHMAQDLQISRIGPTTYARAMSQDPVGCNQYVGLEFSQYLDKCLPLAKNRTGLQWDKLTGGSTHDNEAVFFNLVGINMSWTDEANQVPHSHDIVLDSYLPQANDLATDWEFDVRTEAAADNDNYKIQVGVLTPYTQRGSGLLQREWARLVQTDMNRVLAASFPSKAALYTHVIGDPACRVDPATAHALGCTGFEGVAIGGMPDGTDNDSTVAPFNGVAGGDGCTAQNYTGGSCATTPCFGNICDNILGAGQFASSTIGYGGYGSSALTPGDPTSYFCQDPAQASSETGGCVDGAVWQNALNQVIKVVGLGNQKTLPVELQDRRYYFRWWGIGMIKYFEAYGKKGPKPIGFGATGYSCSPANSNNCPWVTNVDVAKEPLDLTSLFFDNNYGNQFDKDEYIDRSTMQTTDITGTDSNGDSVIIPAHNHYGSDPVGYPGPAAIAMDYSYGSDTIAANQRYTDWYRRMDREESGMFQALLTNKKDLPGGENTVNITNLAGSSLLAGNYLSYECATQWPNVSIPALGLKDVPWANICAINCPSWPQLYPNLCPFPPGIGVSGTGTLDLDQNGDTLAGCGCDINGPGKGTWCTKANAGPGCVGYANSKIYAEPRLSAYPAVWGGTGGWCPNSGKCTKTDPKTGACLEGDSEGDSYADTTKTDCVSGQCQNPYDPTNNCIFSVVQNTHGSVFQVANNDPNNARLSLAPYKDSTGAEHPTGTDSRLLLAYVNIPNMSILGGKPGSGPFNNNTDTKVSGGQTPPAIGAPGSIQVSVPWVANVEGVGFNIPLTGTTNKFVQTAQLDFTGVLETYLIDYVPWTDSSTGKPDGTLQIEAIEGDDYLGEVFLCQDTGSIGGTGGDSTGTQDLLGVHMYDSAGSVVTWLENHPGSQDTCNIILQYSQYDNFLDYIATLSYGVVLGVSQGSGNGRITDIQLFDPNLASIP